MNVLYDLPFFRNSQSQWLKSAFGGWTISAVTQFQSGTPFSVGTSDDFAGVGTGSGAQYWVVNGDPELRRGDRRFSDSVSDANYWFAVRNPDGSPIFTRPTTGTFNTQSVRNLIYGPGFQAQNLAVSKTFPLAKHTSCSSALKLLTGPIIQTGARQVRIFSIPTAARLEK